MNLKALFETQSKLDADILAKHPVQEGEDRLSKKILALQVELGECANEWRGFKFWSNDQEPRTVKRLTSHYAAQMGLTRNPLLEEYVDCFHFILSIGIDASVEFDSAVKNLNHHMDWIMSDRDVRKTTVTDQFIILYAAISDYDRLRGMDEYYDMMSEFFILGILLGFTDEVVEESYYEKNKINHKRQQSGY